MGPPQIRVYWPRVAFLTLTFWAWTYGTWSCLSCFLGGGHTAHSILFSRARAKLSVLTAFSQSLASMATISVGSGSNKHSLFAKSGLDLGRMMLKDDKRSKRFVATTKQSTSAKATTKSAVSGQNKCHDSGEKYMGPWNGPLILAQYIVLLYHMYSIHRWNESCGVNEGNLPIWSKTNTGLIHSNSLSLSQHQPFSFTSCSFPCPS